jgi:prepilin peptidase CpaA
MPLLTPDMLRAACLASFGSAVAVWDVRRRRVPNTLVLAGLLCGLGLAAAEGLPALAAAGVGAMAFSGPLMLCWLVGWVGAGDAKSALAFGALLGMPAALAALELGTAAGALAALACLVLGLPAALRRVVEGRRRAPGASAATAAGCLPVWDRSLPYAAFLALGSALALLPVPWLRP